MQKEKKRIFLSPPHLGNEEQQLVRDAFSSNYIAPLGPQVDAFEEEFAEKVGAKYAVAVSSGTAAHHLLLRYVGVSNGDEVFCSTLTFVASANPIKYLGATPVFIDSDFSSWNMNPELLSNEMERRAAGNRLPRAVVLVHLYGQPADVVPILKICDRYDVPLIEDAAEALGSCYGEKAPGTFGVAGFFSFNGNKIITTSGGGMIVSDNKTLIRKVRFWATQARDDAVHYEHSEVGYNYRMSNILAAIGRGQLRSLSEKVARKREIFSCYLRELGQLPGISFMPEPAFGRSSRWLTCLTIDPDMAGTDRNQVIEELEKNNIEARPTWKPMHLQPLYRNCEIVGGRTAEHIFEHGLCLPSGTGMSNDDLSRVIMVIRNCWS